MWHGIVKDVNNMVCFLQCMYKFLIYCYTHLQISKCNVCRRMNRKMTPGVPELHPVAVKEPWYMVGIDFAGPLTPH